MLLSPKSDMHNNNKCPNDGSILHNFKTSSVDVLIIEGKYETVGNTGDAFMQLLHYYSLNLSNFNEEIGCSCKFSYFFMICGGHLCIYGVLYDGKSICADPLVTMSLLFQSNDLPSLVNLAQSFKSLLKLALKELVQNYNSIDDSHEKAIEFSYLLQQSRGYVY